MPEPKSYREVQDSLGDRFIASVRDFIASEIPTVAELERTHFSHVDDPDEKTAIARAFYEARWIYKTGLALLVRDEAQSAHVRCQASLYGGVCEALLRDSIRFAKSQGLLTQKQYAFTVGKRQIVLDVGNEWGWNFLPLILMAEHLKIVSGGVATGLDELRKDRNSVHPHKNEKFFIDRGKRYFDTVFSTVAATSGWKAKTRKRMAGGGP